MQIDTDVNDHNRRMESMDKRFDSAHHLVRNTITALYDMRHDKGSSKVCALVALAVVVLLLLYRV